VSPQAVPDDSVLAVRPSFQANKLSFNKFSTTDPNEIPGDFSRSCTVHVANIKFFVCPTNVHNSYEMVKLLK